MSLWHPLKFISFGVFPSDHIEILDDLAGDLSPTITGTVFAPSKLFDDDTSTATYFDSVGEYAELEFKLPIILLGYRHYGWDLNVGDGSFKIQYHDGDKWIDLKTGISTRDESWSSIDYTSPKIVKGRKIRIVVTEIDSQGNSWSAEWEFYGLLAHLE